MAKRRAPAKSPEEREKQLIAEAYNLSEQQLIDGTASAQVICHFLKLGSTRNQLELEKIKNENLLLEAKKNSIDSQQEVKELYQNAISAMRVYSGADENNEEL